MKVKGKLSSSCTCLVLEVFIGQHRFFANKGAASASRKFQLSSRTPSPKSLRMAPCFYCRPPVPTHEYPKKLEDRKLPVWVGILMGLFVTSQVTLMIALLMEMARGNQQQEVVQKLQEEIKTLNQELQEKSCELEKKSSELQDKCMELQKKYEEVKQLRQENEALVSAKCPPNSGISLRLSMTPAGLTVLVLLTLSLQALMA